jgi:hypothetical protein
MCLYWGVFPVNGAPFETPRELLEFVVERGRQSGVLRPADRVVLIAGSGVLSTSQNVVMVHEME